MISPFKSDSVHVLATVTSKEVPHLEPELVTSEIVPRATSAIGVETRLPNTRQADTFVRITGCDDSVREAPAHVSVGRPVVEGNTQAELVVEAQPYVRWNASRQGPGFVDRKDVAKQLAALEENRVRNEARFTIYQRLGEITAHSSTIVEEAREEAKALVREIGHADLLAKAVQDIEEAKDDGLAVARRRVDAFLQQPGPLRDQRSQLRQCREDLKSAREQALAPFRELQEALAMARALPETVQAFRATWEEEIREVRNQGGTVKTEQIRRCLRELDGKAKIAIQSIQDLVAETGEHSARTLSSRVQQITSDMAEAIAAADEKAALAIQRSLVHGTVTVEPIRKKDGTIQRWTVRFECLGNQPFVGTMALKNAGKNAGVGLESMAVLGKGYKTEQDLDTDRYYGANLKVGEPLRLQIRGFSYTTIPLPEKKVTLPLWKFDPMPAQNVEYYLEERYVSNRFDDKLYSKFSDGTLKLRFFNGKKRLQ
jgi:hypothetical protein